MNISSIKSLSSSTMGVKRSAELEISLIFSQWLQIMNNEPRRRVEVHDLIAGGFLCDPMTVISLADDANKFRRFLEKQCRILVPAWLYQHQFNLLSHDTENSTVAPFSDSAKVILETSELIALEMAKSLQARSGVTVSIGHLFEAILLEPGTIAEGLRGLGFTVDKLRQTYIF